ncbi:MAG TPA: SRPBCC domain-containing protein [Pseudonocardia sp.]
MLDIEAPPETVFGFFVDPATVTRWLALEADLDPRPGGVCHQVHEGAPPERVSHHMQGEFLVVEPSSRVVFTWGFTDADAGVPPGGSTVDVTLTPDGTRTRLVLVHRHLPPSAVADHSAGWTTLLERLRTVAAR